MLKRIILAITALAMTALLMVPVAAAREGFLRSGWFASAKTPYGFLTDQAKVVFNNEIMTAPRYDELYAGSSLYIPIVVYDAEGTGGNGNGNDDDGNGNGNSGVSTTPATEKQIKTDNVDVIFKTTDGGGYIESVTIVDGKKEKIDGLEAGAYAKVTFSESYPMTGSTTIGLIMVLSINNISYQETEIEFEGGLTYRTELIHDDSVYSARLPAKFEADWYYNGEATFDMGGGVKYTGQVAQRNKYIIDYDIEYNTDVGDMHPEAYLEFYNFRGDNDIFADVGVLEIPVNKSKFPGEDGEPAVYAYRVEGGRLISLDATNTTYDSKTGLLRIYTQSLDEYVLSNRKLLREVDVKVDDTFKSGYAESDYEAPAVEAVQAPATGGAPAPESSSASSSPPIPEPPQPATSAPAINPPTGGSVINASNTAAQNPITGAGPVGAASALSCTGAVLGIITRKKRPR